MTIEKLGEKSKLADVIAKLNEVVDVLNRTQDRRGPKSEREMSDDDARRILHGGDLEKASHKSAAETLGLSYAQIYSCRKEFTFKHVHKEIREKAKSE